MIFLSAVKSRKTLLNGVEAEGLNPQTVKNLKVLNSPDGYRLP